MSSTWAEPRDIYALKLQYAGGFAEDFSIREGWDRVFEISKDMTLESLGRVIPDILGWDPCHLFEFHIQDKRYVHFGDDDYFFLRTGGNCISCDVPFHVLDFDRSDTFQYIFDFGDWHTFVLSVMDARQLHGNAELPALLSYQGKNIVQHPRSLSKRMERRFQATAPTIDGSHRPRNKDLQPYALGILDASDFSGPRREDRWRVRFVQLSDKELLEAWRKSRDKNLWERAVTVLENRNLNIKQISEKIERPVPTIQSWIKAFNRYGIEGITPKPITRAPDRRKKKSKQKQKRLLKILHDRPASFRINRSNWSLRSLALAYEKTHGESICPSTVSRLLRGAGYGIKRAKTVLTSPDPEYREKVELVLKTLQNLQPGELFFFVDEMGPLRVKKYGGRTYAKETISVPQVQAHKGTVTLSGALSATTNQVTWIHGKSKDTSAMIDLMEMLFNQHNSAPAIYVTWDAASWHDSINLNEWLDRFNTITQQTGQGPVIYLVPLPTSSQFLNVIESIFSGMARAVIHHSDYGSAMEMKTAISGHFRERNTYFQDNPKRVGKKIWQEEFFSDFGSLPSGNYREW